MMTMMTKMKMMTMMTMMTMILMIMALMMPMTILHKDWEGDGKAGWSGLGALARL